MYGIKAFNFYMLVERDRWQGSPITRHGTLRPDHAPFYRRFTDFLERQQFWRFFRKPQALVLLNYDLGRFAAANSRLNYGHSDLLGLPTRAVPRSARPWLSLPGARRVAEPRRAHLARCG